MAKKNIKKCSKSLDIREMHSKITLRFDLTPIRMAKIKKSNGTHAGKDMEKEEYSFIAGGIVNWYNHSGNQSGSFSENWK